MAKDAKSGNAKSSYRGGYELRLIGEYSFDEATSALQKMIRRNKEYEACWWAYVLHDSGYYKYVWRRLMIIASEDVGNANPMAVVIVNALRQNYEATIDSKTRLGGNGSLFIFQAVMYLCSSEKLREVDTLANLVIKEFKEGKRLEIPEVAVDVHTARGKTIHGRWEQGTDEEKAERAKKWYEIWSYVTPASKKTDKYLDKWKKLEGHL
ncbi:hypothetical protein H0V99_04200 [Candidatus Saccharibacteria bacterium]|nr:hypothetical protein [Candidatus Saccharibacteria bacterium]